MTPGAPHEQMIADSPSPRTPPTPAVAARVFTDTLSTAERYVALLASTGMDHGLIGPREAPRLWDRHVLNCAVIAPAFGRGASVIDIGSGAGLPGLCLAIARPDLEVHLVEPLARRCTWLATTVVALGLANVTIHNARAEQLWGTMRADHVTARAVKSIDLLAGWALPLLRAGGTIEAIKGARAVDEIGQHAVALLALGASDVSTESYGAGVVDPETMVLRVRADRGVAAPGSRRAGPLSKPGPASKPRLASKRGRASRQDRAEPSGAERVEPDRPGG